MLSLLDMFHVSRNVIVNRADLPGRKEDIDRVAAAHSTAVTAALPLDKELLASYLDGVPVVRSSPDSLAATVFMDMAEHIAAQHIRKEGK
jgi:MinD superfamily P-loop ATPase